MIPNKRVCVDGEVLINRGAGLRPGVWLFDPYWVHDSGMAEVTVAYDAVWNRETEAFDISDTHITGYKVYDDDGEVIECGLHEGEFVDAFGREIIDHFLSSCLEDVHVFEMGELA